MMGSVWRREGIMIQSIQPYHITEVAPLSGINCSTMETVAILLSAMLVVLVRNNECKYVH